MVCLLEGQEGGDFLTDGGGIVGVEGREEVVNCHWGLGHLIAERHVREALVASQTSQLSAFLEQNFQSMDLRSRSSPIRKVQSPSYIFISHGIHRHRSYPPNRRHRNLPPARQLPHHRRIHSPKLRALKHQMLRLGLHAVNKVRSNLAYLIRKLHEKPPLSGRQINRRLQEILDQKMRHRLLLFAPMGRHVRIAGRLLQLLMQPRGCI